MAVFVAFRCTGGCLFNVGINASNPKCKDKLEAHWKLFRRLWAQFQRLFDEYGYFDVLLEWPRSCTYWREAEVLQMFDDLGVASTKFDGCQLGLKPYKLRNVDIQGDIDMSAAFLKKPWELATNIPTVLEHFTMLCPGQTDEHVHVETRGDNAKHTVSTTRPT